MKFTTENIEAFKTRILEARNEFKGNTILIKLDDITPGLVMTLSTDINLVKSYTLYLDSNEVGDFYDDKGDPTIDGAISSMFTYILKMLVRPYVNELVLKNQENKPGFFPDCVKGVNVVSGPLDDSGFIINASIFFKGEFILNQTFNKRAGETERWLVSTLTNFIAKKVVSGEIDLD